MFRPVRRVRHVAGAALWLLSALTLLGAPVAAAGPGAGRALVAVPVDPGFTGYPNAMAATGDSITRAFNTGPVPFTDNPADSWSTGTTGAINSHYLRILAAHPAIGGHNNNDAVTGAQMTDLNGQVQNAVSQQVDYDTILMGANDVCASSEAAMTPVATLTAQFVTAMNTLTQGRPNARVYLLSIPNIYNLWSILHTNQSAVNTWNLLGICQSMLLNPQSMAQADIDRRARVNQRVLDDNAALAKACGLYVHCRFDNNAVFNTAFVPSDVSTRDYFHPADPGQTKLAQVTYPAGYDFTDTIPPLTTPAINWPISGGLTVALSAVDNAGPPRIEYKINGGAYTRYAGAVVLPSGSTITYRAVDVNGNIEASHALTAP